jgi:hypothetical protein
MNFPKYWARGTHEGVHCWRWSNLGEVDAQAQADAAARALAARLADNQLPRARHDYYGDRPLRETVLREFPGRDGAPAAIVTRNGYGCLVLNAARALFVDVDRPDSSMRKVRGSGGLFDRLFGRRTKPDPPEETEAALEPLRRWQQSNPAWSWRIYRTRAGYRLLATHDLFEPESSVVGRVFDSLGADPLYCRLCRSQQCFRARLTPKPWRCGCRPARHGWFGKNVDLERGFGVWQRGYEKASSRYATCRFIRTEGSAPIHADLSELIAFHDETSRAMVDAPLA